MKKIITMLAVLLMAAPVFAGIPIPSLYSKETAQLKKLRTKVHNESPLLVEYSDNKTYVMYVVYNSSGKTAGIVLKYIPPMVTSEDDAAKVRDTMAGGPRIWRLGMRKGALRVYGVVPIDTPKFVWDENNQFYIISPDEYFRQVMKILGDCHVLFKEQARTADPAPKE